MTAPMSSFITIIIVITMVCSNPCRTRKKTCSMAPGLKQAFWPPAWTRSAWSLCQAPLVPVSAPSASHHPRGRGNQQTSLGLALELMRALLAPPLAVGVWTDSPPRPPCPFFSSVVGITASIGLDPAGWLWLIAQGMSRATHFISFSKWPFSLRNEQRRPSLLKTFPSSLMSWSTSAPSPTRPTTLFASALAHHGRPPASRENRVRLPRRRC